MAQLELRQLRSACARMVNYYIAPSAVSAGIVIVSFGVLGFLRNSELAAAYALSFLCHTPVR